MASCQYNSYEPKKKNKRKKPTHQKKKQKKKLDKYHYNLEVYTVDRETAAIERTCYMRMRMFLGDRGSELADFLSEL